MEKQTQEKPDQKNFEIVLRDVDILLRKKLGNDLVVDSFTTSSLIPFGENYGSSMLRVDLVVRRDGRESEPEKLSLVAKMTPPTEFQKMIFDSPVTFPKEIYMFEEIVPAYKTLERECGIPEEEVFDPLPELYGARLSLNDPTKFDHDAVILMENLKVKNYYCENRHTRIDFGRTRLVVKTLARFHALGIAVKLKKVDLFDEFRARSKHTIHDKDIFMNFINLMFASLAEIPAVLPYLAKIEELILNFTDDMWCRAPVEPWGTIIHADLWVNNVMFRDDENGDPKSVKIIDFQNYLYSNPLRDLVFFIFSSCQAQVYNEHLNDILDLYYDQFTSHLAMLKCDVSLFSRKSFDEQLGNAGHLEFIHCLMMIKVIGAEFDTEETTVSAEMFDEQPSAAYIERLTEITLNFVKANWI